MSWTEDMDRLKGYAIEHPDNIFTQMNDEADTYWEKEDIKEELVEYMFDTPAELIELVNEYVDDVELVNILVASAFKKRDFYRKIQNENEGDTMLPDYVYNF